MISIQNLYEHFLRHPIICTDTRKIIKSSIFFALKGENFNGNKFASLALVNGAAFAVVDEEFKDTNSEQVIFVDDVLITLQQLATYHRKELNIPLIAITGSNGKTTTKELIYAVLKKKYNVLATLGNLNNHIGVPLTLLMLNKEHEIAVIEMGANHQKEIAFLCEIAQPNQGLITNIGKAHLEGFGGEKGVLKGKGELYDYLRKHNGTIYINNDSDKLKTILKDHDRTVTYGTGTDVLYCGESVDNELFLNVKITNPIYSEIKTQLTGIYNLENVMAAVAVGAEWNVEGEKIKNAIQNYEPTNQRSQIIRMNNINIVLDAYNANPTSVEAAIKNFLTCFTGKKIIALGDMLELGDESEREHLRVAELLNSSKNLETVILVGPCFYKIAERFNFIHFNESEEAKEWFAKIKNETFNVLIKGSRGIKMEKIMDAF